MSKSEKVKLAKLASKSFISVTKNGVWGDPRNASAKDGKGLLEEIVTNLQKKCQTCLTGKSPKLHQ
jgi:creatinine amidohydrolase